MYCIQMVDNRFGRSKLGEVSWFCSIPDSGYLNGDTFKSQFDRIVELAG